MVHDVSLQKVQLKVGEPIINRDFFSQFSWKSIAKKARGSGITERDSVASARGCQDPTQTKAVCTMHTNLPC